MPATLIHVAAAQEQLTGIVGFALRLMTDLGELGVGLLSVLETAVPVVPSEVILPLAGFLAKQGSMSYPLVLIASILGAYVGALILYALGAIVGLERAVRWLSHVPLLTAKDFDRATSWFRKHGKSAVFFGRLVPGVRSIISLPAGADRMNLLAFSVFTLAGSAIWNVVLISLGYALGSQYDVIAKYADFLNYAVYLAIVVLIVFLIVRRIRRPREEKVAA
jgi:membrane protein DedA with SNARE-associated domain